MTRLVRNEIDGAESQAAGPNRAARRRGKKKGTRVAAGAVALAAVATVGMGQMVGQGQAAAALPTGYGQLDDLVDFLEDSSNAQDALASTITQLANGGNDLIRDQWRTEICASIGAAGPEQGGADCTGSTGTGIAVVLPTSLELVPTVIYDPVQGVLTQAGVQAVLNRIVNPIIVAFGGKPIPTSLPDAPVADGEATVIGDGFQFALASGGGEATAISYLPLSLATAGASDGRQAYAFAVIGLANAWTTADIPITLLGQSTGLEIPGLEHVSCYGVVTAAYAEEVGACVNILGVSDFTLDLQQGIPEAQFALTDPSAMFFDPAGIFTGVVEDLFAGNPLTLSKDFARLSVGGDHAGAYGLPSLVRLTSDYGLDAPVTIGWLGGKLTLFAPVADGDQAGKVNYLALPLVEFNGFDATQTVPTFGLPGIDFPFGIAENASLTKDVSTLAATSADDDSYVGKHRADDAADEYVGKHRADTDTDTDTDTVTDTDTDVDSGVDADVPAELVVGTPDAPVVDLPAADADADTDSDAEETSDAEVDSDNTGETDATDTDNTDEGAVSTDAEAASAAA